MKWSLILLISEPAQLKLGFKVWDVFSPEVCNWWLNLSRTECLSNSFLSITSGKVVIAPGPSEINDAKEINAEVLLNNGKALDISQLTTLIKDSSFIIANDTGPAHIAAHVGAKGLTLFGKHTTADKVSIERENFKAIQVTDLNNLSANKVFERLLNLL